MHANLLCARTLLLSAIILSLVRADPRWEIQSFKRLTVSQGWVLKGAHLLWTDNNGDQWKDITPSLDEGEWVGGVFFLDDTHGWCVLQKSDADPEGHWALSVATTTRGQTWTRVSIATSDKSLLEGYGGNAEVIFVDELHGWTELSRMSSSAMTIGALLATSDGGKHWSQLPDPPIYGDLGFSSREFGWVVGGPLGNQLHITRDGGRSWFEASVVQFKDNPARWHTQFGQARFADSRHGIIPVTSDSETQTTVTTYVTYDGGKKWRRKRTIALPGRSYPAISFVGMHMILMAYGKQGLLTDYEGSRSIASLPWGVLSEGSVVQTSFCDELHGWIEYTNQSFLSTNDDGRTVAEIELPPVR